ncbi:hypothetical protein DVH24_040317 [Malus domestica]|uniref:Uncharacterized protein n=1 Tax=Malus domestica TaxID=3750 RepID=A0A498I7E9_MALDO|nr:hypothetical protein DVH24_040317 [Malus domestica]
MFCPVCSRGWDSENKPKHFKSSLSVCLRSYSLNLLIVPHLTRPSRTRHTQRDTRSTPRPTTSTSTITTKMLRRQWPLPHDPPPSLSPPSCSRPLIHRPLQLLLRSQKLYVSLRMSFMVGYGARYPQMIHHRSSSSPSVHAHPARIGCKAGPTPICWWEPSLVSPTAQPRSQTRGLSSSKNPSPPLTSIGRWWAYFHIFQPTIDFNTQM